LLHKLHGEQKMFIPDDRGKHVTALMDLLDVRGFWE